MSEEIPPPEKMVSRSVAIGLGIICIAVVAGLVGAVAYYASQISSLNSKVNDLTAIVNLNKSTVWVNGMTVTQTASNYTSWFFTPMNAGYIWVNVSSSTSNTYVRVIYTVNGDIYDNQSPVGYSGTAVFAVLPITIGLLPMSNIEIKVGNTNGVYPWASTPATETVTITYYY